jgi:hypothetical protein
MTIRIKTGTLDELSQDGVALGFFSDERPPRGGVGLADWRMNGALSRQMADGRLAGSYLEKVLIATNGRLPSSRILLIGLGNLSDLTYDTLYMAGYTFAETIGTLGWDDFAFEVPAACRSTLEMPIMTEAVMTGFFDAFSKDIGRLETLSPVLLIGEEMKPAILAGVERFRKNTRDIIPVEMEI